MILNSVLELTVFITCQNLIEIFASMFVWRYVCLSVCLFVWDAMQVAIFEQEVMYKKEPYSFPRSKVK